MSLVKIISIMVAFFQFLGMTFNVLPYETKVDYGGDPYVQEEITQWLTLINGGVSDYKIILGAEASVSETTAANELQSYLAQISGVTLPIIGDSAAAAAHEIIVGRTNREGTSGYTIDRAALGDEGFVLLVVGEKLVIAGGQLRGTLYGVYTFLEEQLGCRWFTDSLSKIPSTSTVKINAQLNDTQKPVFDFRCTGWNGSVDWRVKHKYNYVNQEKYGYGEYYASFCHTMDKLVPDSLFETHPEYFAYREDIDGRSTQHACLTNPDVLTVAIANARSIIQDSFTGISPQTNLMGVGQKDNMEECQCEHCKAFIAEHESDASTLVAFTNAIADALGEEFPEIDFVFLAYQNTRKPPKGLVCRDNVIPFLCAMESCFVHPLNECGHEDSEVNDNFLYKFTDHDCRFAEELEGWAAISKQIHFYDYTVNFLNTIQFYPNFATFAPNFQYLAQNKVTGLYESGAPGYGSASGEFGELRAYLVLKTMWDPTCDVEYHMMDFMKAYYGEEAAKNIKEYIDTATAKIAATGHAFCFDWHYQIGYFTIKEMARFDTLWDNAETAAKNNPEQLARIKRSRLQLRYYKANLFMKEFNMLNPWRGKENEKLYDDLVANDIRCVTAFSPLLAKEDINFFTSRPIGWR